MTGREPDEPELLDRLVAAIPPAWLARQRWFRSKDRSVARLVLDDEAALPGSADSVSAALLIVRVEYDQGPDDRYLLPAVVSRDTDGSGSGGDAEAVAADRATGTLLREPRDGEGVWAALARSAAGDVELPARRGRLVFRAAGRGAGMAEPRTAEATPPNATERRLGVEQTNTSVAIGERLYLKCYRRLENGINPELEMVEHLAERTSFRRLPGLVGSGRYAPPVAAPSALALLQRLVPARGDAWRAMLTALAAGWGPGGRQDASLSLVDAVGALTGELHGALTAAPSDDDTFPVRSATARELGEWRAAAEAQLEGALASVRGEARDAVRRLAPAIRAAFEDLSAPEAPPLLSRIHGDYHLGQLLDTDEGLLVTDFEGEPARPLDERRRPHSPLKDVAGMLRSLDYAARSSARDSGAEAAEVASWLRDARGRLLAAYAGALAAAGSTLRLDAKLLRAFEIEKACYEVRYEAANRPDWIWLPIAGLEALLSETRD